MKNVRIVSIIIFFSAYLSFVNFGFTQDQKSIDSMRHQLENTNSISQAAALWHGLTEAYGFSNIDSALYFVEPLVKLKPFVRFLDKKSMEYIAYGFNNKGVLLLALGRLAESMDYLIEGARLQEIAGNQELLLSNYQNISIIYKRSGSYSKSLDYHLKALSIAEKLSDSSAIYKTRIGIADIYYILKEYDEAQNRYEAIINEVLKSNFEEKLQVLSTTYSNYSKMLLETKIDLDKSLELIEQAIELSYETNNEISRSAFFANRGGVYYEWEDYEEAIKNLNLSLEIRLKYNLKLDVCATYTNLSKTHHKAGNKDSALYYGLQAYIMAKEFNSVPNIHMSAHALSGVFSEKGEYKKAFEYFQDYHKNLLLDKEQNFEKDIYVKEFKHETQLKLEKDSIEALKNMEIVDLKHNQEIRIQKRNTTLSVVAFLIALLFGLFIYRGYKQKTRDNIIIDRERKRSDELLLNILPEQTAAELKAKGRSDAEMFDQVTVLFTDFKGFTALSEILTPQELVDDLNVCFSEFDRICQRHGIEKIKTIGDAYMAAGGLPIRAKNHAENTIKAALEMIAFVEFGKQKKIKANLPYFEIRIGVHTGPVVAGIVGIKKFQYDIWGNTVNTANRMESSGAVGRVNVSQSTYEIVNELFDFTFRGKIEAKGKGEINMYFVEGPRPKST